MTSPKKKTSLNKDQSLTRGVCLLVVAITLLSGSTHAHTTNSSILKAVDEYLKIKPDVANPTLHHIGLGSIDGCLLDEEFWQVYFHLKLKYPQYVSNMERFGLSY
jgi:hypothetical protein